MIKNYILCASKLIIKNEPVYFQLFWCVLLRQVTGSQRENQMGRFKSKDKNISKN